MAALGIANLVPVSQPSADHASLETRIADAARRESGIRRQRYGAEAVSATTLALQRTTDKEFMNPLVSICVPTYNGEA